jgi:hypothetical protein
VGAEYEGTGYLPVEDVQIEGHCSGSSTIVLENETGTRILASTSQTYPEPVRHSELIVGPDAP